MERLILWDIDGTLIRGAGVVAEAFRQALRSIYRLEGEIARISYAGKTDGLIAMETLAHHDLAEGDVLELLDTFREAYTAELERARHRLVDDLQVLPGVRELLARLGALGVRQTLLTGNFETTARLKLACAGLDHHFDFEIGAFGSDHLDRNYLVPIALEKLRRAHGVVMTPDQTVVVGDTPRDIECARAAGARIVAVATGTVSLDELAEHAPDVLLPSLEDTERALAALIPHTS